MGCASGVDDCNGEHPDLITGNDDCCSPTHLCAADEGDCDTNSDCEGELTCGVDNCAWGDADDCCESVNVGVWRQACAALDVNCRLTAGQPAGFACSCNAAQTAETCATLAPVCTFGP